MIRLDLKRKKKSGVTELVLKIRRIKEHSISRISGHSGVFWPDSLLSGYIQVEESYRFLSYVCLTQHTYIGLFDRSLLHCTYIV